MEVAEGAFGDGVDGVPEVEPLGVGGFDEGDLPGAAPAFDDLLAGYGGFDVAVVFEPDQMFDAITGGEARGEPQAVFRNAA